MLSVKNVRSQPKQKTLMTSLWLCQSCFLRSVSHDQWTDSNVWNCWSGPLKCNAIFFLQLKDKAQQWASPVTVRTDSVDMTSSLLLENSLRANRRNTGANNENRKEKVSERTVYIKEHQFWYFGSFSSGSGFSFIWSRLRHFLKCITDIYTLWKMKIKMPSAETLD